MTALIKDNKSGFLIFFVILALIVLFLFRDSFKTELVVFANDGPLGAISTEATQLPGSFLGFWMDIYLAGYEMPSAVPNLSVALALLLKPLLFAKFYVPFTLLILGVSAYIFFRQVGFNAVVCSIAGLAAALNMNSFSNACWGQCSRALTQAATFLALAAIISAEQRRPILKLLLAGMAVGFGIMEGFDVGALYSLVIAAFVIHLVLIEEGNFQNKIIKGIGRVAIIAVFSAVVAAHVIITLLTTQIIGVAGTEQDSRTKTERWYFATQWSLPKIETLRVIIPGLFGYRMVDAGSRLYEASYWGQVGRDPRRDLGMNVGYDRHSGSGEYAGILVVLIAGFAVVESFRKKGSVYTERQKRMVRFWLVTAIICLLLAWGRHAPFYKLIYALPFFSTIRNPIKFMHMFHLALIIMFGFGLAGLWARYISGASVKPGNVFEKFKLWLKNAGGSERLYFWGLIAFVAISVLGAMVYATSRKDIENHLLKEGFSDSQIASQIANFSINEVGLYLMFLVISVVAIVLIMSGFFAGQRSKAAGLLLGAILVFDLCRANAPWIIYYDYKEKYATNPVIDYLRQKPCESRVTFDVRIAGLNLLNATGSSLPQQIAQLEQTFAMLYYQEWLQHHFLYYNIQTANYPQMPRMPKDYETMLKTFSTLPLLPRYWQLMNTKYLVGLTMFADLLNNHLDPAEKRFKVIMPFDLEPKPGVERATRLEELTAAPKTNGLFALIEWQAALPRAALYTHWISATNEQEVLQNLTDLNFDLSKTVVVLTNLPAPASAPVKATPVEIKSYSPKRITFEVENKTPSVLLLNDRYAPDWKVWVDGKQSTIFRANYLMRGIFLEPGKHEIVFRFLPSPLSLFVSLSAIGLGIFIGIYLLITHKSAPPNNAKQ
jgi:hypothetical protein